MQNINFNQEKIKNYVFRLLSYRAYTIFELEKKLRNKKKSDKEIKETIYFLKKNKLVNDRLFAKQWIEQRIKFKPRSKRLIEKELLLKGIDKKIIDQELNIAFEENKEIDIAILLIEKKKLTQKEKIYQYLSQKGFSFETIRESWQQCSEKLKTKSEK